jgi:hypothetical protein
MALNKKGIHQLADALVAEQKRYDQDTFGERKYIGATCSSVCCLAGMSFALQIGNRSFTAKVKAAENERYDGDFNAECEEAGRKQLGLKTPEEEFSDIFRSIYDWPNDLSKDYHANGPKWRVIAALKALQRLRPDGSIDPNPDAIHTRLPQLKKLLAQKSEADATR